MLYLTNRACTTAGTENMETDHSVCDIFAITHSMIYMYGTILNIYFILLDILTLFSVNVSLNRFGQFSHIFMIGVGVRNCTLHLLWHLCLSKLTQSTYQVLEYQAMYCDQSCLCKYRSQLTQSTHQDWEHQADFVTIHGSVSMGVRFHRVHNMAGNTKLALWLSMPLY